MKSIDLTNQRFGLLVALQRVDTGKPRSWYRCICDCGVEKIVSLNILRQGKANSCGCQRSESIRRGNTKHGHYLRRKQSPTYLSWVGMVQRCTNQSHTKWPSYGGRGITVCERWMTFSNFLQDMGERPSGTTIDRISNELGYMPGNCRWADPKTQANNRRQRKLKCVES